MVQILGIDLLVRTTPGKGTRQGGEVACSISPTTLADAVVKVLHLNSVARLELRRSSFEQRLANVLPHICPQRCAWQRIVRRQEALRRDQAKGAGEMSAFVVCCLSVLLDVSQNHQGGEQRLVSAHENFVREQRDQELDAGAHVLLAQRAIGHQRSGRVREAGE